MSGENNSGSLGKKSEEFTCRLISVMLESGRISGRMNSGSLEVALELRLRVWVV